jgi:hypothetical protein
MVIDKQSNISDPHKFWKQDSLILNAEELLESDRYTEALIAFRKAYVENPEHYYLDHYIKHTEFILGPEYETNIPVLESYTGEYLHDNYGTVNIFKEDNQFFVRRHTRDDYKMLPLSEDQFMFPSVYQYTYEFVKEDDRILGFKVISIHGNEYFFAKTSTPTQSSQIN